MADYTYGAGASVLGLTISGWHLKNVKVSESYEAMNIVKTGDGYYIPASLKPKGKIKRIVETWEPDGDEASAPTVVLGSAGTVKAVDSASMAYNNSGRPVLTINGHEHLDIEIGAVHIAGTYSFTFAMPSGAYGSVNPFDGATISGLTDYQIQTSTQSVSIDHQDEVSGTGSFLVGVCRGVKVEGMLNAVTDCAAAIGTNGAWTLRSKEGDKVQDQIRKLQISGEKYVDESAT